MLFDLHFQPVTAMVPGRSAHRGDSRGTTCNQHRIHAPAYQGAARPGHCHPSARVRRFGIAMARCKDAQHPQWRSDLRGPGGRRLCRWCCAEVPKGRRTFCDVECVSSFQLATGSSSWIRSHVYVLDHGICAACGLDAAAFIRAANQLARWIARHDPDGQHRAAVRHALRRSGARWIGETDNREANSVCLIRRWLLFRRGWTLRAAYRPQSGWEADHIVPVCQGGGRLGLSNLRTLCWPCHHQQTAALAGRRAAERRAAKLRSSSPDQQQIGFPDGI